MAHATETSVKWFHSGMQSAPWPTSWTGSTGASQVMVDILRACLVNGFNSLTFDSIVVTSGVARATRSLGHGFVFDQIVNVSGATPSGLNGDKRIIALTNTYIEFDATGISDGSATGTIVIMTAPAGWDAPFSSTNKLVLRSPDIATPRSFFRFDESTGDRISRQVQAYASMTDIDTGTDQWAALNFNTPYNAAPLYATNWLAGRWFLIADNKTAWIISVGQNLGQPTLALLGFGAFTSFKSNDSGNDFLQGIYPSSVGANYVTAGGGLFGALQTTQLNSRTALMKTGSGISGNNLVGGYGASNINTASGFQGTTFPSPVDNGLILADSLFRETTDGSLRGKNRGAYWCMQDRPLTNACPGLTVTGISGLEGRTLMLLTYVPQNNGSAPNPAQDGRVAFDITGPWG